MKATLSNDFGRWHPCFELLGNACRQTASLYLACSVLACMFIPNTVEPLCNEGAKKLARYVRYKEVSLFPGSFPYILVLLGRGTSFVILKTLMHRGSLNQGPTVHACTGQPWKLVGEQ